MSGLLLPKHVAASRKDAAAADAISKTSKHRYDSDDWLTTADVREQLEKLQAYIDARREDDPDYNIPSPSGWKLMCLALTIPDKVGSIIVIDDSKEARSLSTPQGVILAIGPQAYQDPSRFREPWHAVGDRITWTKYDASMFQIANGQRLAFLNDTQPLGCIDKGWKTPT